MASCVAGEASCGKVSAPVVVILGLGSGSFCTTGLCASVFVPMSIFGGGSVFVNVSDLFGGGSVFVNVDLFGGGLGGSAGSIEGCLDTGGVGSKAENCLVKGVVGIEDKRASTKGLETCGDSKGSSGGGPG